MINTETPLMSLESFRRVIAYHPFHFWGIADNNIIPVTSSCNDIVYKHSYQNTDAVGREEIIEAIKNAEYRIATELGYWPAPKHFIDTVPFPKYHNRGIWNLTQGDNQYRWLDVQLPWGYVEACGPQQLTSIGVAAVTLSDADGDGLNETFVTANLATTITNPDLIWAVFITADRLDDDLANWRVHPVKITIAGGNVSVKGKAWQIIQPIRYEGFDVVALDPTVAANFAAQLEIYAVSTNTAGTLYTDSQAALVWETAPHPGAECCGSSITFGANTDPAAVAYGVTRAGIRHYEEGIVNLGRAVYNQTTANFEAVDWGICRPPERVIVRYRAGYPLDANSEMDRKFQVGVARMAAAELARPICACDEANRELYRWQFDLARTGGANDESYGAVSATDLDNPFGTRRGHVYAWRMVKEIRKLIGIPM